MIAAADLRALARTTALLGLTPAFLSLLELERARGAPALPAIRKWTRRYGVLAARLFGLEVLATGPFLGAAASYPGHDARGRGRVFVANHRSMLDVFVCLSHVQAEFLARGDISRWPLVGFAARRIGTVFVDRESRESGAAAVAAMGEALVSGRGVLVFPEGTTFAGDEVRPFRSGAFRTAVASGAEIVPLGMAYSTDESAYGDEGFFSHYRRVAGRGHTRVALVAGEPVRADHADPRLAREEVRARVQALVATARAELERPPGVA